MCYTYFRLYHTFASDIELQEKLQLSYDFLNDSEIGEKSGIELTNIFPYKDHLSTSISVTEFEDSLLEQPDFFLRIRPGQSENVIQKLNKNNIAYEIINASCIRLSSSTNDINKILKINKEVVIQDKSSQSTADLFDKINFEHAPLEVWDACAGSGGKTILLYDYLANLQLTATDNRGSILKNLKSRLKEAEVPVNHCFKIDLTRTADRIKNESFDLIVADVPCTGSGTWSRNPENLAYFDEKEIDTYASRQKQIIANCLPKLKKGGYMIYLTCSVFKEENEENINFFIENYPLDLIEHKYFIGIKSRADTLFGSVVRKR